VKRRLSAAFARDLASSYAASVARVASWLIVSALVFRRGGADDLALLMLLRGTVGLLSYAGLGLAPSLVHLLARPLPAIPVGPAPAAAESLGYAPAALPPTVAKTDRVFTTALLLVCGVGAIAVWAGMMYVVAVPGLHGFRGLRAERAQYVAACFVAAVVLRLIGDVLGARMQATNRLWFDNAILVVGEVAFVALVLASTGTATQAALAFGIATFITTVTRAVATIDGAKVFFSRFDRQLVVPLLGGGGLVLVSQLADWFYGPLNLVLLKAHLSLDAVVVYVPALQVDAALLLLTAGLTNVLLPKSALYAAAGDRAGLRRAFVGGSAASLAALSTAAFVIWIGCDTLFRWWFGDPLVGTQAILPWVLLHTVLGSVGGVGRAVLLGMGRIKPYALAAITAGVANALLAIGFVAFTDWGLRGVVLATIISVGARSLIWTPWYTLRAIRQVNDRPRPLYPADAKTA
jgi:O-antigen/teichoic acid export membrane protein